MVAEAIVAAGIGAAGSLLGGMFDRNAQRSRDFKARRFEKQRIQMITKDALAAGIHPLAALGSAAGFQNPFAGAAPGGASMGGAIADAASQIGAGVAQAGKAKSNEAILAAQLAESRSRTILNQANAKRALIGPGSTVDPFAPRQENALVEVELENGERILIPNPELYEISPSELATGRILIEGGRGISRVKKRQPKEDQTPEFQGGFPRNPKIGDTVSINGRIHTYTRQGWKLRR